MERTFIAIAHWAINWNSVHWKAMSKSQAVRIQGTPAQPEFCDLRQRPAGQGYEHRGRPYHRSWRGGKRYRRGRSQFTYVGKDGDYYAYDALLRLAVAPRRSGLQDLPVYEGP